MDYEISFEEWTTEESEETLYHQLGKHNKKLDFLYNNHNYYRYLIKKERRVLGGIEGYIWLGINHIDRLFIKEKLRGKGFGKKLLRYAEEYGKSHEAYLMALETLSLQKSLGFYKNQGFSVVYEDGGLNSTVIYHLRKKLIL